MRLGNCAPVPVRLISLEGSMQETATRGDIDRAHEDLDADRRLEEFKEEAGEFVGEMPQAPPDNTSPPLDDLRVDGTAQLGLFHSGGKKPTSASIRLSGGKVGLLDGKAYQKGDVIHFEGTAVVDEVGQKDKADPKTGIVVSCEQKHVARITDLTVKGS